MFPLVARWWPERKRGSRGPVVVDPRRAFGAPVVAGTGVRTEDVFDLFQPGASIQDLIDDYGLTSAQFEAAVRLDRSSSPTQPLELFVDRSLGLRTVPDRLRREHPAVIAHDEVFPRTRSTRSGCVRPSSGDG